MRPGVLRGAGQMSGSCRPPARNALAVVTVFNRVASPKKRFLPRDDHGLLDGEYGPREWKHPQHTGEDHEARPEHAVSDVQGIPGASVRTSRNQPTDAPPPGAGHGPDVAHGPDARRFTAQNEQQA